MDLKSIAAEIDFKSIKVELFAYKNNVLQLRKEQVNDEKKTNVKCYGSFYGVSIFSTDNSSPYS